MLGPLSSIVFFFFSSQEKTTRRSLIVATVTSSSNSEEVGLRSCSVGDRTQDQKANRALTTLYLDGNNVGGAGAAALAEALKATALTGGQRSFRACACCYQRCHFTWRCEQLASSGWCERCVAASVFFLAA